MTYSFDEMQGFVKECRKNRTSILEKLGHDEELTIDSFSIRANSHEDLAKAVFHLANDLNKAKKWIEKVHGEHFAAVKELAEARKDNVNQAKDAVNSLKSAINEK
jgi:tRNA isopentenyl-2-thiomethyl-A-37 hydroxylase MiaE